MNLRCRRDSRNSMASGTRSPVTTTRDQKTAVYGPPRKLRAANRPASPEVAQPRSRRTMRTSSAPIAIASQRTSVFRSPSSSLRRRSEAAPGRDAGREEQGTEDRAVPREARRHRAEEEAGVEAEARPDQHGGDENRPAPFVGESKNSFESASEDSRHPLSKNSPLFAPQRPQAERQSHRIDEPQNPRAPRHGRRRPEDRVEAPRPEPVREVEPQREHAERQERERCERARGAGSARAAGRPRRARARP